ncbi:hypothetical protein SAMN04488029_2223 [Reichenbachiella faecimaris]|uniref:Uncharacterized protein n=1 Tax=Reichenbachiella faecimaris TaxID=692418 RepID=A0A1W2GE52_REIFA|nr:hypothetical protein [Reichenbachiella faecimaris]SMD34871.1 hypothetical protein SAMN04488029_2223 [Reichenbachiella faecimaris]
METLRIDILNPKARKLLDSLQEMNLIKISQDETSDLKQFLKSTRKYGDEVPSESEILTMVKEVRAEGYGEK